MNESRILHFLKEFPAWLVILFVFMFVFLYYIQTKDDFVQRLVDAAMGSLFTALVSNRAKQPTPTNTTETGDIIAPENLTEK